MRRLTVPRFRCYSLGCASPPGVSQSLLLGRPILELATPFVYLKMGPMSIRRKTPTGPLVRTIRARGSHGHIIPRTRNDGLSWQGWSSRGPNAFGPRRGQPDCFDRLSRD